LKTKHGFILLGIVSLALLCSGCTTVPPGSSGIIVNNYGTQRGVQDIPIKTGRISYNPVSEDVYIFPNFVQRVIWTQSKTEGSDKDESITFNSVEGAKINTDVAVQYQIHPQDTAAIFIKYRHDTESIADTFLHDAVRNAMSLVGGQMKVTDIIGTKKKEFEDNVTEIVKKKMAPIEILSVNLTGDIRPDKNVTNEINLALQASIAAVQAENKVKQTEAEARQKVAKAKGDAEAQITGAQGEARANQIRQASLTDKAILLKQLEIEENRVDKWNGKYPETYVDGGRDILNLHLNKK
jgi:regulator of protease activity HflC (stomatin/prohibitin superfamily)